MESKIAPEKPMMKPTVVLIAIDTASEMFMPDEEGETPFKNALKACHDYFDKYQLLKGTGNNSIGIIFANNDENKATFIDFKADVVESFRKLQKAWLLEDKDFLNYQRKDPFDLAAFFQQCKQKFKEIKGDIYEQVLVFISNNDKGVNTPNERFTALNEAKNFDAINMVFELITTSQDFKYNHFYSELFSLLKNSYKTETICEDASGIYQRLMEIMVLRHSHRKLNFYPFQGDLTRYIRVYSKKPVTEKKFLYNAAVSRDGKLLKRITKVEGSVIYKVPLPVHPFIMTLSLEEKMDMESSKYPTGYTLLYVDDRTTRVGYTYKDPNIIQPMRGEHDLFNQFWQHCFIQKKVLVCARKYTKSGKIHLVELIPKCSDRKNYFLVQVLPYCQNVFPMEMPQEQDVTFTDKESELTRDLVNKLTFDYDPKMFPNNKYQLQKSYMKSKMLNEPMDEVRDETNDNTAIDETLESILPELSNLFQGICDVPEVVSKRKAPAPKRSTKKVCS